MQIRRFATLVLAVGFAFAGMRSWSAHAAVQFPPDLTAPDSESALHRTGNPLWTVPIGDLSATRDRPVFSASRRPARPVAVFVAAPPPPSPGTAPLPDRPPLVLLGTIIGGPVHIGIFHEESTTKTVPLSVGESREGWILRSVSANDASFEAANRAATLILRPSVRPTMEDGRTSEPTEPLAPVRHRKR